MDEISRGLVEVALPLPLFQTFTYAFDESLADRVVAGARVVVPFRNKRQIGICIGPAVEKNLRRAPKKILDAPDAEPAVGARLLELCRWISEYYVVPLGVVLRTALPILLTGAENPRPARKTRRIVKLTPPMEDPSLLERDTLFGRAKQQRATYEMLESLGGESTVEHLQSQLEFSPSVLASLAKRGLVVIGEEEVERDPFLTRALHAPSGVTPSDAQSRAVAAIHDGKPGDVFLLHGVTGSGKTLVYIELLKRVVLEENKTAIVLVPEIALTPQTVDRFRAVFGDSIAVLHSALSDGERYDAWLALKRGDKKIAVGARSAIFAPLENLGAIVVDEEHESSYKQGETPRYHAREVAVVRGAIEGAVTILGSATPSLESWSNAHSGKFTLLQLPERVAGNTMPEVEVVDLRRGERQDDALTGIAEYDSIIREPLDAALISRLARGEQSILLLNRRGYSSFLQCMDCGAVATCPHCSITLTHHRAPERLICHYCLHREDPPENCRECGGKTIKQRGVGTQQLERVLGERFPDARIARMDVDTTSGKWSHTRILDRVGAGEIDILLGTQMIAKGLDFPNVTLVGVVDADVGINLPDFRASERAFQLIAQVAGRAGRGPKGGAVIIQTRVPKHHAIVHAVTHDYESFAREEIESRESPPYPPHMRLVNVIFSGVVERETADLALAGKEWLERLIARRARGKIVLVGAAPCAIERIKNRWRWHLVMKSDSPADLTRVGRYFVERFEVPATGQMRITFDRDPVSLL
ncbi:MAG: primosomal protein N' [Gemmatimonadota bacterium]|nr:primosomal protein N' [Gemmatimonadota bacterium]